MIAVDFPLSSLEFDPEKILARLKSQADWIGLRWVEEIHYRHSARNQRVETNQIRLSRGMMVEAVVDGYLGYSACSDLSEPGLKAALERAIRLAKTIHGLSVSRLTTDLRPRSQGNFGPSDQAWLDSLSLQALSAELIEATRNLKVDDRIDTTVAEITFIDSRTRYLTSDDTALDHRAHLSHQHFGALARDGQTTQQRSLNGPTARCWQGGLELLDWSRIHADCIEIGEQALALLAAENCPDDTRDLILAPDQMLLQIHESVGHPLELDRILGDERNYAGWSFVRGEDFGKLQYGSPLMNVVFDPGSPEGFAGYPFDDGGATASRCPLITRGRLLRGLGGLESQRRLGVPGVANFRASSWNRAPIDRMANINLEPGTDPLDSLIEGVERGIMMWSNRSWSIDDYRDKFQFGCEYAQLIEEGRLTRVVKNPNYRGRTLAFWHALDGVGSPETFESFGTPFCGKGEPNQMIRVGHASPVCRFRGVEVFGGET